MHSEPLDWSTLRSRLQDKQGPAYWRSLEELAESPQFEALIAREFPEGASVWDEGMSRRRFLQLMGASVALAGLTACTGKPADKIVPYVRDPETVLPGKPQFFASAMPFGGYARGVLVETHLGRPTKIEGNPDHPISLGATDPFMQASILDLYDPDRSQTVKRNGTISTWGEIEQDLIGTISALARTGGQGLYLVTGPTSSPTLLASFQTLLAKYPRARWIQYDPLARANPQAGARLATGRTLDVHYRLDRADVILSLDADFLFEDPASLRLAREFSDRRRVSSGQAHPNRLYVLEATHTITGAKADHRLAVPASSVHLMAHSLAGRLGLVSSAPVGAFDHWLDVVARDLQGHRGRSVVIAGHAQPPEVHALALRINQVLGNLGQTVYLTEPVMSATDPMVAMQEFATALRGGQVDTLLVAGANPVWTAPAELELGSLFERARKRYHWGLYEDETAARCEWHMPATHYLEAWGDARAADGTISLVQPAIAPLYEGRSLIEMLALLNGVPRTNGYDLVRATWQKAHGADFEAFWQQALQKGILSGSALAPVTVTLTGAAPAVPPAPTPGLEVVFRPDPTVWDGSFANNAWLQELPKPLTKLTWDTAALVSPATAERLGLDNETVVELGLGGRTLRAPVWIMPGHADDSVTLTFGYGRAVGRVAGKMGYNAYALRDSQVPWFGKGLTIKKTGDRYTLATTQHHFGMHGRDLIKELPMAEALQGRPVEKASGLPSLYPQVEEGRYAWGMSIDPTVCIGCNACVIGCQSENNIPVVGKEQVLRNREMHWLRIDRYYQGSLEAPKTSFQPVPCMHCEKAPCEVVCPTEATVHDDEGINDMVYNRCIGTRYCSNNCPYKVRRFNFFQYSDWHTESLKPMRNPDVTVRSRGVMEKCTYCIQRIQEARGDALAEGRPIRDGEVRTACQSACPTRAIVFGDLNDPNSEVSRLKRSPLDYPLLGELNTQPRTTYLAEVRNPHPELG